MRLPDIAVAIAVSGAVHAGAYMATSGATGDETAGMELRKGTRPVALTIVAPSPAPAPVPKKTPPATNKAQTAPKRQKPAGEKPVMRKEIGRLAKISPVGSVQDYADKENGELAKKGFTSPASVIGRCVPEYPLISRKHGEKGTLVIAVEVGSSGKTGDITIVDSTGYPRLDRAGLKAVKNAEFRPAIENGRPVDSIKKIKFVFSLKPADS